MATPKISVLLPTLNEAENIARVITTVRSILPRAEIVVIDGLSTDKTVEIARSLDARIILEKRKGKGFAIKTAFQEVDSDVILMIDADLTYPAELMPAFVEKLKDYDVVMGSRFRGKMAPGAMSTINNIGNRIISLFGSVVYLKYVSDICTGMWAFNKKAYKSIEVTAHTFELECNMFAQSVKKGLKIIELPIDYAPRGGTSKVQLA
ncbi:glycosyltransferase, partial [Candidatus Micrarchaeota archaeon]|nr:glycosyltransferase [Candidatus Micrarchaeota archaeon]